MKNWNSDAVCTRVTKDDNGNMISRLWNDSNDNMYLDEWINNELFQTKIPDFEKSMYLNILYHK